MADKPILFSAPMVRALLEGRKTQTRRIMKPQPELSENGTWHVFNAHGGMFGVESADLPAIAPDYVRYDVGDRLWVRESLSVDFEEGESYDPMGGVRESACGVAYGYARGPSIPYHVYAADREYLEYPDNTDDLPMRGIPSIHMPKWASRLTLTVTDVRVERLKDISEDEAVAEGVQGFHDEAGLWFNARDAYCFLWNRINGPDAWEQNPWVVAVSFEVLKQNIDEVA